MAIDVFDALKLLNTYLQRKGHYRSFVICGGASMILRGIQGRGTGDIDIIGPGIDQALKEASLRVADDLGLHPEWLNDSAMRNFAKDLAPNWEDRVFEIYSASNLVVKSVSNFDLAVLKFLAECDRQKDMQDLVDLNLSEDQIEAVASHALLRDPGDVEAWPEIVEDTKTRLRRKIGYGK